LPRRRKASGAWRVTTSELRGLGSTPSQRRTGATGRNARPGVWSGSGMRVAQRVYPSQERAGDTKTTTQRLRPQQVGLSTPGYIRVPRGSPSLRHHPHQPLWHPWTTSRHMLQHPRLWTAGRESPTPAVSIMTAPRHLLRYPRNHLPDLHGARLLLAAPEHRHPCPLR
jgi:hypothetical protein